MKYLTSFIIFNYLPNFIYHFRNFRIIAKSTYYFRHVRPSACISSAPTGRISMIFDNGDFYENPSIKSKFGYKRTKISETLQIDPKYVPLPSWCLNGQFYRSTLYPVVRPTDSVVTHVACDRNIKYKSSRCKLQCVLKATAVRTAMLQRRPELQTATSNTRQ